MFSLGECISVRYSERASVLNFIPIRSSSIVVAAAAVTINFTQNLTVLWTLKTIKLMESLIQAQFYKS